MQDRTLTTAQESIGGRATWRSRLRDPWVLLWMVLLAISSVIVIYSQTMAFVWDEGFHLIAAQLIARGKTPYIDFAFPQTLLNAYFNAAVLRFAGHSWRAVHFFDALFVSAAVCLAATYVMRRFPEERWRLACAIAVACFVGFDTVVVAFGPVAQAYGFGMLLTVLAFRVAVRSVDSASVWTTFAAALLAGAAAGSSLLTAPVLPVLLVWIVFKNRAGSRISKLIVFCAGALIAFAPELWLFFRAPKQTFFNVVQYQALFRRVNWGDVNAHDFDVFTDWTVSAETLLLGLLSILAIRFISTKSGWDRAIRSEFYLAAWISVALGAYIATAHPTFGRYFIFMIPFTAIVASVGFYYTATQLAGPNSVRWPLAILVFILFVSAAKYVFDDREGTDWHAYEKIAQKVKEVTPPGQEYMADELVYFLLGQTPPSGMEFSYSHKIELPPKDEALFHTVSLKELKNQIARGRFQTVETCKDEVIDDFKLNDLFPNKEEFDDCTVFWRKGRAGDSKTTAQ